MFNIDSINSSDFYFNGHWLSEFNGKIGGKNGLSDFSILPSKEIKTEKILGVDGEYVTNSTYNPRSFIIPVFFEKIDDMRNIASWLNVKQPTDFYFNDGNLKIKAVFSDALDLSHGIYNNFVAGDMEIKFTAYDPYFKAINDIDYTITKFDRGFSQVNPLQLYNVVGITQYDRYTPATYEVFNGNIENISTQYTWELYTDGTVTKNNNNITIETTTFNNMQIFNDGNIESYPIITVYGTGNIAVNIGSNSFTINNVNSYASVNMQYYTCFKDTTSKITDFVGNFFTLPIGINYISVTSTGTINSINVKCNSRWI